jgi:hypothetical protein
MTGTNWDGSWINLWALTWLSLSSLDRSFMADALASNVLSRGKGRLLMTRGVYVHSVKMAYLTWTPAVRKLLPRSRPCSTLAISALAKKLTSWINLSGVYIIPVYSWMLRWSHVQRPHFVGSCKFHKKKIKYGKSVPFRAPESESNRGIPCRSTPPWWPTNRELSWYRVVLMEHTSNDTGPPDFKTPPTKEHVKLLLVYAS